MPSILPLIPVHNADSIAIIDPILLPLNGLYTAHSTAHSSAHSTAHSSAHSSAHSNFHSSASLLLMHSSDILLKMAQCLRLTP